MFVAPLSDIGLHRGPLQVAPVSNVMPSPHEQPWRWGPTLIPHLVIMNPKSFPFGGGSPSMNHWLRLLHDRFNVDRAAIVKLGSLASHSIHGYEEANSIAWKMVKKKADKTPVDNPSAFVQKSVANAWMKLLTDLGYRLPVM